MNEQDQMDQWLARSMSAPVPTLSPDFDRRLTQALKPRRLNSQGRVVLALYALVATLASVWTMRAASIEWTWVVAAIVVPMAVVALVFRRQTRRPALG